jgi:hypothetical protein
MSPADERGSTTSGAPSLPMTAELRERLATVEAKLEALRGHL